MSDAANASLESRWDAAWYGAVPAIRPFLFLRGFLLLVAYDAWCLLLRRGGDYGVAGFNVSHFAWLDALQPLPTPASYTALVIAVGGLALFAALTRPRRWLIALVCGLYTYGWCMSLLDMYQHHYLISVVLLHLVFFPGLRAADVAGGARTSAWAYKLLGATIAVVYAFTAIAKLDATWRSGETLLIIDSSRDLFALLEPVLSSIGIGRRGFYAIAANGAIAVELAIAATYLVALRSEARDARWRRLSCYAGWVLAVSLHVGFELLDLVIGIFGAYMIFAASTFLLPEPWLRSALSIAHAPARALEPQLTRLAERGLGSRFAAGAAAVLAGAALVGIGAALDLPGAAAAGAAIGGLVAATGIARAVRGNALDVARSAWAALACGAALWIGVETGGARAAFYEAQATGFLKRGDRDAAFSSLAKAREHWRRDPARLVAIDTNLGALYNERGRHAQGLVHLREALGLDPTSAAAHFNAGVALQATGDLEGARRHHARASQLDPLDVDAHVRLAAVLERLGRPAEAAAELRRALEIDPQRADAWRRLARVLAESGSRDEALRHWERAVELAPDHFATRLRLADALRSERRIDAAIVHLRAALRIRPDSPRARDALAAALRERGRDVEAAALEGS